LEVRSSAPVAPDDALRMWPVSRRVNRTRDGDDDPGLIKEIELHA
jgi:hypothetical protein